MNKLTLPLFVAAMVLSPAAGAQERSGIFNSIELGLFGQYTRFQATATNSTGLGARASFGVWRHVGLEAEMGYDFSRVFTEGFTRSGSGTVTQTRSDFRLVDALFGPKLQTRGRVRLFFTAKGGFVHTNFSNAPATFSTFTSTVESLRLHHIDGAGYPGLGLESYLGPLGLRLEAGDLIYFRGGAHHNLQVSFGPNIRF